VPRVPVGEALEAYRATRSEADRNRLAAAIRALLLKAVRYAGVSEEDVEDVAQDRAMPLLAALVAGAKSPEALVWRAGANAGNDWHRRRKSGIRKDTRALHPADLEKLTAPAGDEGPSIDELLGRIARVTGDPRMRSTYREALNAHYGEGRSILAIAEEDLQANPTSKDGSERTLAQARSTVEQRLKRARDWVRARVHRGEDDEGGR